MPFIGTAGSGPENNDSFAFYAGGSLPLVRTGKNGKINLFAPTVEKLCIFIKEEKGSYGSGVPVILFAKDT